MCWHYRKSLLLTPRQKFVNTTAQVCYHWGKSLLTSPQKFVNTKAKVS